MERGERYWDSLSLEDRKIILAEGDFWEGFSNYLWVYLPDNIKLFILSKANTIN